MLSPESKSPKLLPLRSLRLGHLLRHQKILIDWVAQHVVDGRSPGIQISSAVDAAGDHLSTQMYALRQRKMETHLSRCDVHNRLLLESADLLWNGERSRVIS